MAPTNKCNLLRIYRRDINHNYNRINAGSPMQSKCVFTVILFYAALKMSEQEVEGSFFRVRL